MPSAARFAAFAISIAATVATLSAAEIELRASAQAEGPIVRLRDVAEIYAEKAETAALLMLELFPAPLPGIERELTRRELYRLLELRGVDMRTCRLTGAEQTWISARAAKPVKAAVAPAAKKGWNIASTEEQLRTDLLDYLRTTADQQTPWEVELQIAPATLMALEDFGRDWQISGGAAPFTGPQVFTLHCDQGRRRVPVAAVVSAPQLVAATTRPLAKGTILQASDLVLRPAPKSLPAEFRAIAEIEQGVGQEVTRAYGEGLPLDGRALRRPIVVKKGAVVTILSRAPGVLVRTFGRAQDDGAEGDLVGVEPLEDRKQSLAARVVGPQQVEIFAAGVQTR